MRHSCISMRSLTISFFVYQGLWCTLFCAVQVPMTPEIQNYRDEDLSKKRTERDAPGYCPDGWVVFGDYCYKAFGLSQPEQQTWHEAVEHCASFGASLTSIHYDGEQAFLSTVAWDISTRIWIGLRRQPCTRYSGCSSSDFKWQDNSPNDYSNWRNGLFSSGELCVYMIHNIFITGKWEASSCDKKLPYICKKLKDPTLSKPGKDPSVCVEPEGWLKIKNSCYKVFSGAENRTTWDRAESFCNKYAGNLASVISNGVTLSLSVNLGTDNRFYWIGVKSMTNHEYTWLGIDRLTYTNWLSDEPRRDVPGEVTCVAIDNRGRWMVRQCNENNQFICEVREDAPTLAPHHVNMICPDTSPKWKDFGGKYCYITEVHEKLQHAEASSRCCREGGFLASFHSIDEINVIVKQPGYHADVYIGFSRGSDGEFAWEDGSVTDFVNWDSEEPAHTNSKCTVMLANGRWHNIYCHLNSGYVCSAAKVPKKQDTNALGSDSGISSGHVALIVICLLAGVIVAAVAVKFYFFSKKRKPTDESLIHNMN